MKTIFAIISLLVAYVFGAIVGAAYGFDPVTSGLVSTVGTFFAVRPAGVLSDGPDVSEVNSQLNAFVKANIGTIWNKIRQGIQLRQYMETVSGVTGLWTGFTADVTELHQPFQKGTQWKGTPSIEPYLNTNYHVKIDVKMDELHNLWNGWLNWLADEEKTPDQWPFVKYIVYTVIVEKMIEEMNDMYCRGSFVAPTVGVAGGYLTSMTGLFPLITSAISAGDLTATVVGATDATNGVDQFEGFVDSIPAKYKDAGGKIFTSITMLDYYRVNYRDRFGSTNDKDSKNVRILDRNQNIEIVGLTGAAGVNRMVFIPGNPKAKLKNLVNKLTGPDMFNIQLQDRDVKVLHDRWDGVGLANLDGVRVSDVA